jgi:futalosine hydrolase
MICAGLPMIHTGMSMITDICGMHILLAAATTLEIQPTTHFLEKKGYRLGGHDISVLITGVGSMAALYSLLKRVQARRPDLLLQAGIAGCLTGKKPGEVVAVKEEMPDLGVWEGGGFKTLFDLGLAGRDDPPYSGGLLINPYKKLLDLSGLEQVRAISVNEITTDPVRIGWYQQNGKPVVESMEGSALHYSCLHENIPFLQIRSVSNEVGVRDKTKWDIPAAVRELNETLIGLMERLAGQDKGIFEKIDK